MNDTDCNTGNVQLLRAIQQLMQKQGISAPTLAAEFAWRANPQNPERKEHAAGMPLYTSPSARSFILWFKDPSSCPSQHHAGLQQWLRDPTPTAGVILLSGGRNRTPEKSLSTPGQLSSTKKTTKKTTKKRKGAGQKVTKRSLLAPLSESPSLQHPPSVERGDAMDIEETASVAPAIGGAAALLSLAHGAASFLELTAGAILAEFNKVVRPWYLTKDGVDAPLKLRFVQLLPSDESSTIAKSVSMDLSGSTAEISTKVH
jgi:hypothetical protein